jgi:hypothetical protein
MRLPLSMGLMQSASRFREDRLSVRSLALALDMEAEAEAEAEMLKQSLASVVHDLHEADVWFRH